MKTSKQIWAEELGTLELVYINFVRKKGTVDKRSSLCMQKVKRRFAVFTSFILYLSCICRYCCTSLRHWWMWPTSIASIPSTVPQWRHFPTRCNKSNYIFLSSYPCLHLVACVPVVSQMDGVKMHGKSKCYVYQII